MCNFTGKISASFSKLCLEVVSGSVHAGFNLNIRANDVVNQGSHFLSLKIGLVELLEGVVDFI